MSAPRMNSAPNAAVVPPPPLPLPGWPAVDPPPDWLALVPASVPACASEPPLAPAAPPIAPNEPATAPWPAMPALLPEPPVTAPAALPPAPAGAPAPEVPLLAQATAPLATSQPHARRSEPRAIGFCLASYRVTPVRTSPRLADHASGRFRIHPSECQESSPHPPRRRARDNDNIRLFRALTGAFSRAGSLLVMLKSYVGAARPVPR